LASINSISGFANMTELFSLTTIPIQLTDEPTAITGCSFTQSWIKVSPLNEREPHSGLSGAVIAGIASGSVIVIVIFVVITFCFVRNAKNESQGSVDAPDLRGEVKMAKEPGLIDEEEP
jgi:hypothetical protein